MPQGRMGSLVPSANPPPALSFGPVSVPWALSWGPTVPGAGVFSFVLESGTSRSPRVQRCWRMQACHNVSGFPGTVTRGPGVLGRSPPGLPSSGPAGRALTAAKAAGGATAVMWTAGTSRAAPQPQGQGSALGRPMPCPPGGVGLRLSGQPGEAAPASPGRSATPPCWAPPPSPWLGGHRGPGRRV